MEKLIFGAPYSTIFSYATHHFTFNLSVALYLNTAPLIKEIVFPSLSILGSIVKQ